MGDPDNNFQFRAQQDLYSQLLQRVKQLEIDTGPATPWSPILVAAGGSIAYSPGSIQGMYLRRKDWVTASFQMVLAGWSASGSFAWALRTPWPPRLLMGSNMVVGHWWGYHIGTGDGVNGTLLGVTTTIGDPNGDAWFTDPNGDITITNTSPWTWANGDRVSGSLSYQVAPGY